jgi:hypothetical protein
MTERKLRDWLKDNEQNKLAQVEGKNNVVGNPNRKRKKKSYHCSRNGLLNNGIP